MSAAARWQVMVGVASLLIMGSYFFSIDETVNDRLR